MTRFDAATPTDRRKLFVEALTAHRERGSPFLTIEVDPGDGEWSDGLPWIQFAGDVVNLDCTDAELERLKTMLQKYPAFKIDDINRPEEVPGTNVRISAKADKSRVAGFLDEALRSVYELPEEYRAWVTEV
jgi:hypothetical protein